MTDNTESIVAAANKALQEAATKETSGFVLKFTDMAVNGLAHEPNLLISFAKDHSAETVKLIFHVKNVSLNTMDSIGKALSDFCVRVLHQLPGNIRVEASESPVFRNQWDFIVWGVPLLRGTEICNMILKTIKDAATQSAK